MRISDPSPPPPQIVFFGSDNTLHIKLFPPAFFHQLFSIRDDLVVVKLSRYDAKTKYLTNFLVFQLVH